jgi:hypothetical protein
MTPEILARILFLYCIEDEVGNNRDKAEAVLRITGPHGVKGVLNVFEEMFPVEWDEDTRESYRWDWALTVEDVMVSLGFMDPPTPPEAQAVPEADYLLENIESSSPDTASLLPCEMTQEEDPHELP